MEEFSPSFSRGEAQKIKGIMAVNRDYSAVSFSSVIGEEIRLIAEDRAATCAKNTFSKRVLKELTMRLKGQVSRSLFRGLGKFRKYLFYEISRSQGGIFGETNKK